ncbi:hypothetical protein K8S19_08460 [bacterium]|nr:hypothetical protein [bacterium]
MKKGLIAITALFLLMGGMNLAEAKKTTKTVIQQDVSPSRLIDTMKPGFAFDGSIDIKMFNMTNANFIESSDWYFYPVYQIVVANVFKQKNFGLYLDVEKPGYANITYPFIKVNELFAKFRQDAFYVKLGRQVFGDKDDLLLGFENDAVSLGFDLGTTDLLFFLARTQLITPWNTGGNIESLIGFVPDFSFGKNMGLRGYLLVGMEPITITSGTPPTSEDSVNTLIQAGGKYSMDMQAGSKGKFGLDAQVGIQFGMAKTAGDDSIDATALGMKLDAGYAMRSNEDFAFKIAGHVVYTGGDPDPLLNTKAGFASLNNLSEAGPGMFSQIQDGAGPLTYLDGNLGSVKIDSYMGVLVLGVTGEFDFGMVKPGVGLWTYSDTDDEGEALGVEFDLWAAVPISEIVSFYGQFAYFVPNRDGIGWPPSPADGPENASKFLVGSTINF